MDRWKKQSAFRSIFKKVPKTKMISKMKLSLFETVYARRVVIFPLKFYCELSTTLRRHHTPMTTASTYSSGMRNTRRPRRGLGNWAAPATDQNQCRRTYKTRRLFLFFQCLIYPPDTMTSSFVKVNGPMMIVDKPVSERDGFIRIPALAHCDLRKPINCDDPGPKHIHSMQLWGSLH